MRKKGLMLRIMGAVLLSLHVAFAAASTPKFSIVPILRAPSVISANEVAQAQYWVTNNTAIARVLTMSSISGVNQITNSPGACSSPFYLLSGQSCMLILQIRGIDVPGGVHSNVVVCKTLGAGDNHPDPYLCSQNEPGQGLDISFSS